ncbi:sigma-70 family RNA polymerase sigma factor [Acinetobacter qingfengensis]|uniref:Uncharacterized protein n=1 Tax=Acinetobacter qingfengensis TaxID=1262585 RepID=A0A1E7R376_9GAMM|nr:sigma-70 family RNA polymerase sigma factor [Acinetobacter qingfengensis]KAA8733767.1 sigma-70 family RNA polymerase sigma factor [Acinetobacter qingfengensis]OEY93722.1 hypothetical protein BJI46_04575 [Acinetobacter qingfengensis]
MFSDKSLNKHQITQHVDHLYRDHQPWLYGWFCRKLGNRSDAADLTHDTFVKIISRYTDYYYYEPRALLTTVAKSLLFNLYRRRRVEQAYLAVLAEDQRNETGINLEDHILLIETLCELSEIIESMPDRPKQVFILAQLQGVGYAGISEQLGISIATVKRDLAKAMALCFMAME